MRYFVFIALLFIFSCQKETPTPTPYKAALMEIPKGFPVVDFPEDNAFTEARWALGKKLFYDPMLSADSSISCASCHAANLAFSDDKAFSIGVENRVGERNSSPLFNVAYHPYFTREGGVPTLEMQILVPIQEHSEMATNIVLLAERLKQNPTYVQMAKEAYDREPDPFVITRSIATFERSLLSGYSRYDQFQKGETYALHDAEQRGKDLFFSEKTNCSACHSGFNFTNYAFENNGLYENYADEGRFRLTGEEADRALFKVPSLRNIELTAPYMHDGSMATLEEVVVHYNSGGAVHPHKSNLVKPLNLTEEERADLVAFLRSLTDEGFVTNSLFTQ